MLLLHCTFHTFKWRVARTNYDFRRHTGGEVSVCFPASCWVIWNRSEVVPTTPRWANNKAGKTRKLRGRQSVGQERPWPLQAGAGIIWLWRRETELRQKILGSRGMHLGLAGHFVEIIWKMRLRETGKVFVHFIHMTCNLNRKPNWCFWVQVHYCWD